MNLVKSNSYKHLGNPTLYGMMENLGIDVIKAKGQTFWVANSDIMDYVHREFDRKSREKLAALHPDRPTGDGLLFGKFKELVDRIRISFKEHGIGVDRALQVALKHQDRFEQLKMDREGKRPLNFDSSMRWLSKGEKKTPLDLGKLVSLGAYQRTVDPANMEVKPFAIDSPSTRKICKAKEHRYIPVKPEDRRPMGPRKGKPRLQILVLSLAPIIMRYKAQGKSMTWISEFLKSIGFDISYFCLDRCYRQVVKDAGIDLKKSSILSSWKG